jgi:hypothetical protein
MRGGALWRLIGLKRREDMSNMEKALEGLQDGTYKSCREAATACGLNRVQVWRRHTGRTQSRSAANKHKQLLTDEQEEVLASWCGAPDSRTPGTRPCDQPRLEATERRRHVNTERPAVIIERPVTRFSAIQRRCARPPPVS